MTLRDPLVGTARTLARNPVGVATGSVLFWTSALPVFATVPYGPAAVLGGLWTTCLLAGVGLVALSRFAAAATERGSAVPVLPHVRSALAQPWLGLKLGASLFALSILVLAAVGNAPPGLRGTVVGLAGFVVVSCYAVLSLGAPELADGAGLRRVSRRGLQRAIAAPVTGGLFVACSLGVALVAGLTVLAVLLALPAVLALLATQFAHAATPPTEPATAGDSRTGPD